MMWPGVWPGQKRTSKVRLPTVTLVTLIEPAGRREWLAAFHAKLRALLVQPLDQEGVFEMGPFDRNAQLLCKVGRTAPRDRYARG